MSRRDCMLPVALGVAFGLLLALVSAIFQDYGREIVVFREAYVEDYARGLVLLVEYSVDGFVQNAVFAGGRDAEYLALMDHLERVGRVRRVEP